VVIKKCVAEIDFKRLQYNVQINFKTYENGYFLWRGGSVQKYFSWIWYWPEHLHSSTNHEVWEIL